MKHSLKTTVMALAAMFAFNTVADAQIAEMVTYDGKDFTVQHPKEYADVIDDWTPGVVNEWKKDSQCGPTSILR